MKFFKNSAVGSRLYAMKLKIYLRNQSGVELGDMLFFDTESKNVMLWRKTRLPSILCKNGLTLKNVEKGLVKFAKLKRKGLL